MDGSFLVAASAMRRDDMVALDPLECLRLWKIKTPPYGMDMVGALYGFGFNTDFTHK